MQKLSEENYSQKNNINKLQDQLLEYEQNNCKVLDELEMAKINNDKLLTKITEQNKTILQLEEDLKKSIDDKNKFEKENNLKLHHYKNKLEVSIIHIKI